MKASRNDLLGWGLTGGGLIALLLLIPGAVGRGPAPMRVLLGGGAYAVVPFLLFGGVAVAFADRMRWRVRWRSITFSELSLLCLLALAHLELARPLDAAMAGRGGGVVGWAVSQLLTDVIGIAASRWVLLTGLLAALAGFWLALPAPWRQPWEHGAQRLGISIRRRLRTSGSGAAASGGFTGQQAPPAKTSSPPNYLNLDLLGARIKALWADLRARSARPAASQKAEPVADPAVRRQTPAASPAAARPTRPSPPPESPKATKPLQATEPSGKRRSRGSAPTTARPAWLPSMTLLKADTGNGDMANADARQRAQLIKQTLAEFSVPVEIVSIKEGPTVTQFGLEPGEYVRELRSGEVVRRRVSVASILRLNNDLALALAAPSLRIEAPVPGRPYVGIEVPNPAKTLVNLRNILESKTFAKVGSPLTVALGRDVSGDPVVADLTRMPHLLIAGATGSGKSVCVNAIICSLLMNNAPETVRLMMVDPKMVELPGYNGIPHLVGPVITDPSQASGGLAWLMLQMDDRYRAFADTGVRNIVEYNRKMARSHDGPLPYLVLVIDELADLMMTAATDIERQICRLAQMSRATGIHLVLATQRPSVDVITGLIKANFPARIAFAVTSQIDSRVILDGPGAEKLLGRGDMLFMAPDASKLTRIQGCFVSDQEIDAVVAFWKARLGEDAPVMPQVAPWAGLLDQAEERDSLLEQALKLLETKKTISTSMIQRQLRIGFPRAARLMEQLEEMGVVGADEGGGRSREVRLRSDNVTVETSL